jgi:cyanophycinase
MAGAKSTLIAIGGGEVTGEPLNQVLSNLGKKSDPRVVIMTVATSEPEEAADKYNSLFRSNGIKHVSVVNIDRRDEAFDADSLKKLSTADGVFFTGGDQLNITSLLGGSPLHEMIEERYREGVLIAGTSAGAAMMSGSMIIGGKSDTAPRVSGVEIAPGMNLIDGTIMDSHFSERGRHGRLLTAIAHFPQLLGIGVDEATCAVFTNGSFKVAGEGSVTVVDGSQMRHSDLPYKKDSETVGMFGVCVHVLPAGYSFKLQERTPAAPTLAKLAGAADE